MALPPHWVTCNLSDLVMEDKLGRPSNFSGSDEISQYEVVTSPRHGALNLDISVGVSTPVIVALPRASVTALVRSDRLEQPDTSTAINIAALDTVKKPAS
jgi:hypothetical protein